MKEAFLKLFANISIPERINAIYVHTEHGPISWQIARQEVEADTPLGIEIMKFMVKAGLLKV